MRIPASIFLKELGGSPNMSNLLKRYIYVLMLQLTQAATCIHFHEIGPRLARWLLMSHDRAHKDIFFLTHNYLSQMLGVRRSGVSIAAKTLQEQNIISYVRGKIHILNRKGLEEASCQCYTNMNEFYNRM